MQPESEAVHRARWHAGMPHHQRCQSLACLGAHWRAWRPELFETRLWLRAGRRCAVSLLKYRPALRAAGATNGRHPGADLLCRSFGVSTDDDPEAPPAAKCPPCETSRCPLPAQQLWEVRALPTLIAGMPTEGCWHCSRRAYCEALAGAAPGQSLYGAQGPMHLLPVVWQIAASEMHSKSTN